ncbi:MAG: aldo/keto reductase [candidate division NC10 bacterium]|nr:aldo/keto reductase [candidate division NC10 bacterium]
MGLPGHATPEGTDRHRRRFAARVADGHFRRFQELWLSSVGLGTYLGDEDARTDEQYRGAVTRAIELGCNVLDSAINYRHQRSERAVGEALALMVRAGRAARDEIVVATKGGFVPFDGGYPPDPRAYFQETFVHPGIMRQEDLVAGCHCMTPAYLQHQLERSRQNLGLDCVDIYYLHNPETQLQEVPRDRFLPRLREAFATLEGAVAQGRIRMYGTATWNGYRQPPSARDYLSLSELAALAREVGGPDHHFRVIQLPQRVVATWDPHHGERLHPAGADGPGPPPARGRSAPWPHHRCAAGNPVRPVDPGPGGRPGRNEADCPCRREPGHRRRAAGPPGGPPARVSPTRLTARRGGMRCGRRPQDGRPWRR